MAFLRTQLMIVPMIPGRASAAFMPNQPSRDAKALSLDLTHSHRPFLSLGGGGDVAEVPSPPGNNASMSTPIVTLIAMSMEAIVIPCPLNSIHIFSASEVSLSNTLSIVSLKLVIWFFSLPLGRLIDSCLTFKSSFSVSILLLMSSLMPSSYSPGYSQILFSF